MASKPFDVELYSGSVQLKRSTNHQYRVRVDGGKSYICPNATTIIGMKDKSRALIPWALKTAAQAFDLSVPTNASIKMNPAQKQKIMEAIVNAPDVVRDQAGDVGTQVHQFIEDYFTAMLTGGKEPGVKALDAELQRACGQFINWVRKNDVEPVAMEKPIFSKEHFYTGTTDLVLRVRGRLGLWDAKTGKSVYPEVMLQTSAYKEAWDEENPGDMIVERGVLFFPREDYELVGDMEAIVLPDTHERDFAAFLALKTVYRFDKDGYKDLQGARFDRS